MRYGLSLPNGGVCGDARILAELGVLAEEAGWDGVFVEDYIVHQSDGAVPTCDPWIALAAMAVGTKRVRLGTSVTPLNRRRPWKVAREAVALREREHFQAAQVQRLNGHGDSSMRKAIAVEVIYGWPAVGDSRL